MKPSVLTCTLQLPKNYRIMNILSFYERDSQALAEVVKDNRLQKGIVWRGSPACLSFRFLPHSVEIVLCIDHPSDSFDINELSPLAVRMLGLNQPVEKFEKKFWLMGRIVWRDGTTDK